MSADLFEETRMADLQRATQEYQDARQNYQRLVRIAVQEKDRAKREDVMVAINKENTRLIKVVEGLVTAWSEGKLQYDDMASEKVETLEKQLEEFKEEIARLHDKQDSLIQLQSVLGTLTQETDTARTFYYAYIVAVLVLLVIVFIFFVYSYATTSFSAPKVAMPETIS
jgi:hypothetical protein